MSGAGGAAPGVAASRRARRAPQRYQLDKRTTAIAAGTHPWIFRDRLSSAAAALADGQWLRLVDGANAAVAWGVYHAEGAIAIRILARGAERPGAPHFTAKLQAALARRAALRAETDAWRAVHGESDGLPGVVVDVYGRWAVLQTYASGVDGLGRWAAAWLARELDLAGVLWKPARRRLGATAARAPGAAGGAAAPRRLRGDAPASVVVREGDRRITVELASGQKSGAFLDLRGLRRWVAARPLTGARVLNLFAYTGTLGQAAEHAGAAHIVQVDASASALALAARHHVADAARHRFVEADVFDWLAAPASDGDGAHDLIIVDPPSMTSRTDQVGTVLAAYRRLYHHARRRLAPGGQLVVACCTSRVTRAAFRNNADRALSDLRRVAELPAEPDHPVGFPEADYLKIAVYASR